MQLNEALEVHSELNPKLWDGLELKPEVKDKLLDIATTFIEGLEYPLNVADIRFLGSNASYNYNDNSDIDLHIISNFDLAYVDKDILQILYNASKNSFNNHHDITIKDIPVELYIEDMHSMNATNGAYSLLKDEWIMIPKPIEYTMPDYSKELQEYIGEINSVLGNGSKEEVEELINRIYLGRKDGLATDGEASIGNCVFKELRNQGLIEQLRERFYELESQELTLENKLVESAEMDGLSKTVNDALKNEDDEKKQEKIKEYEDYINEHIENVHKAYDRIVKNFVKDEFTAEQLKQLETNLDNHDKDKVIPFMFDAYRRNHLPINDKEKEDADEDYDIAWSYHKHVNPHHWEYWLNNAGEFAQNINEEDMKLAYAEMLCDWLSFGFKKEKESATGESTEFETWYNESKKNIKIHPQLEDWLNDKISQIIDFISENKDNLYESKKDVIIEKKHSVKWHGMEFKTEGKEVLTEMKYEDYKKDVGFNLEYRVIAPLKVEQESNFDTYGDNDYEMDIDIDSLYEAYEVAQKQVEDITSDEDLLKEIFTHVGRGRVYVGNIEIDEDKLDFDIGFSDIIDPVEKGNEIRLDEAEIKDQIVELVECILDNLDYISAKQSYTEYTGDVDEDGDPVEDEIISDETVDFSLNLDKDKTISIKSIQTESKKLEEADSLSRIYSHYQNNPFLVISAERPANEGETDEEARQRNKRNTLSLKNDIRSTGFGFIPVDGGWKEDGEVSYEASFFVPMSKGNFDDFFKLAIDLCNKYNQYAVLVSNGQGDIAYYDKNGNKDMEFKGGISFNGSTIDKNINDADGVGGFTSLNKKNPNKRFQLQEDLIQYKNTSYGSHVFNKNYNKKVVIEDTDDNFTILNKYKEADYGYIQAADLKFIIKTLYGIDADLSKPVDLGDAILTFDKGKITSLERK